MSDDVSTLNSRFGTQMRWLRTKDAAMQRDSLTALELQVVALLLLFLFLTVEEISQD
jgi:hypothetical protein